jgi:hypothetical protein
MIDAVNRYNKYNTYGTLRDVLLGTYFYPEFFSKIKNPKVRDPLMKMADEINQDLNSFAAILKEFNINVIRATQPTGFLDLENPYIPPLQVRNTHAVIGNTMVKFNPDWYLPIDPILKEYCPDLIDLVDDNTNFYNKCMQSKLDCYNANLDIWYQREKYIELAGSSWPKFEDYVHGDRSSDPIISKELLDFEMSLRYQTRDLGPLQGPNVINLPDRILVSSNEYCNYDDWLRQHINDTRPIYHFASAAGHVDGCFGVLGNNTILGIDPFINYSKYFPEHDVIKASTNLCVGKFAEFDTMQQRVNGAWWLSGEEYNDELINYVEANLKSWVGYVAESVFDVNVLPLNDRTICVSNITPEVKRQLKSKKIDCIVVPWRHRFFVDGGLHCITLDLNRDNS